MKNNLKKIPYKKLNARQKENYNYHKVSAVLSDYGFSTQRLSDDWLGADFLAIHVDGKEVRRVQLKGRLTLQKSYRGKNIWIAFRDQKNDCTYLYRHDSLLKLFTKEGVQFRSSSSWKNEGGYSWGSLSKEHVALISRYMI